MNALADAPVVQEDRLVSLDIMRGVALFGILLMNITGFALPYAYADPTVYGGATGADLYAWVTTSVFFEGTQRAIFSLLFGAGTLLLTSRIEARGGDPSEVFFRRNLWLILFGVVHAYLLLWTGEILYIYGVTAPFIYVFRKARPSTLLAFAVGGMLFGAAWNVLDATTALRKHTAYQEAQQARAAGAVLTRAQDKAIKAWEELVDGRKPSREKIDEKLTAMRGSYTAIVVHQAPEVANSQSWLLYRWYFDVWSVMLLGMALFKLGLLQLGQPRRPYLVMALVGYGVGLTVNVLEARHIVTYAFHPLAYLQTDITYDLGRLAMTMGHVGTLMLWCNSGVMGWLQRRLAAVGQMALSNYVSHSLICAAVFYGIGFGLFGHLARHQLYYVVFSIWVFQLVTSPIWLRHFRFGPAEWLWRTLTYGEKQPMRRRALSGDEGAATAPAT